MQINGYAHSLKYLLWLLYSSRKKVMYILHGLEVSKQSGNFSFMWIINVQTFPLTLSHDTMQCIIQKMWKTPMKKPHAKFLPMEIGHCAVFLQNFPRGKDTHFCSLIWADLRVERTGKLSPKNPRLYRQWTISALVVQSEQKYSIEELWVVNKSSRCESVTKTPRGSKLAIQIMQSRVFHWFSDLCAPCQQTTYN